MSLPWDSVILRHVCTRVTQCEVRYATQGNSHECCLQLLQTTLSNTFGSMDSVRTQERTVPEALVVLILFISLICNKNRVYMYINDIATDELKLHK